MVVTPYLTSENGNEYIKGKALTLQYVAHVLITCRNEVATDHFLFYTYL